MPLLFSYGTLQEADVQRATIGRSLEGVPDALPGYRLGSVRIENPDLVAAYGRTHNANAEFTGGGTSVEGLVLELTEAELARVDAYEAPDDYRRTRLTLASGRQAWVFMYTPQGDVHAPDDE